MVAQCFPYISWIFFLLVMVIIPIVSIAHWIIEHVDHHETLLTDDNTIKAILLTYPAMGIMNILFYFLLLHGLVV